MPFGTRAENIDIKTGAVAVLGVGKHTVKSIEALMGLALDMQINKWLY